MKSITTLLVASLLTVIQSPMGSRSLLAQTITTHARFGMTTVKWESTFRGALDSVGIKVETVAPAFFVAGKDFFRFPICGGAVDFMNLKGEISHAGGLRFTQDSRVLSVTDFILGIPREDAFTRICPLSALFTADHSLFGRGNLFDLDFTNAETVVSSPTAFVQRILITNVAARFTENGALQFNQVFGTSFGFDAPVAVFTIKIIALEEL